MKKVFAIMGILLMAITSSVANGCDASLFVKVIGGIGALMSVPFILF